MKRATPFFLMLGGLALLPLIAHAQSATGGGHSHSSQMHGEHDQAKHQGHQPASEDTRLLVEFPAELKNHTLANMRDHLAALQEINEALATNDFDMAGQIAEQRLGMSSLRSHGAHEVASYMPKGMQDAGTAMHRAASRFALEAQTASVTGDLNSALAALGEVMAACVGCHAGYRLK